MTVGWKNFDPKINLTCNIYAAVSDRLHYYKQFGKAENLLQSDLSPRANEEKNYLFFACLRGLSKWRK